MSDSDSDYSNEDQIDPRHLYNIQVTKDFSGKITKDKNKRHIHNAAEQKRRNQIKESFKKLHEVLPNIKSDKASRVVVLQEAIKYIQEKQTHLRTNKDAIHALKRQNHIIENQIQILQQEIARNTSTAMVFKTEDSD